MYKCIKISVIYLPSKMEAVRQELEKEARSLKIEGVMHHREQSYDITIAGTKEQIDAFVDRISQCVHEKLVHDFAVEAAPKERDYRGVFRVIE
jgi:hypothetical protein